MVILGAYLSYALEQHFHIDLFLGLLITMPIMFGFGILIELLFIRPVKGDRTMLSILVTYGVALVIEGVLNIIFSADYVQLHAWYVTASFQVGAFYLSYIYVLAFCWLWCCSVGCTCCSTAQNSAIACVPRCRIARRLN